jgi:hypothetical protein
MVGTTDAGTLHCVDLVLVPRDTPLEVNVSTVTKRVPCVPFGTPLQKLMGIVHDTEV